MLNLHCIACGIAAWFEGEVIARDRWNEVKRIIPFCLSNILFVYRKTWNIGGRLNIHQSKYK